MSNIVSIERCNLTPTYLAIEEGTTFEDWERIGRSLSQVDGSVGWWIADWANFGEGKWGEKYQEAMDRSGLSYDTIAHYSQVAKKIDFSRRRLNLSISHHIEVVSLPEEEQERFLENASQNSWSRNQLRSHVAQYKTEKGIRHKDVQGEKPSERPTQGTNTWLEENKDKFHGFDASKSFVEQLWGMPYLERCIVLGIVMGESKSSIWTTLNSNISHSELETLFQEKGLNTWNFARAILDN